MTLTFTGNEFVNFGDGSFEWVWIDHYQLTAVDDQRALAAMIAHERFGDNHAGGDPGDDPTRHGPYWRDRVSLGSYELVEAAAAESELRAWATAVPHPDRVSEAMRGVYQLLRAADRVYRLRDLGEPAQHDWGGVLFEYSEFVLIGSGTLTVVIAGLD
ncbi:hypothetical protein [Lentzea sp. NBRC 102530]|uniref:hypothetical protein n=1 Tax=Lentzea sp. NBRC 102530 TaxID=3032201 RepID=UPI00249FED1F|nr:hypothetical protein [Lentzea sp. NBRC 102530]GLY47992.1 hypothetical protein Lesp01_16480 [Lentzea sp. NBRC 102530]